MSLSTGFVKVAQSGATIDGREINPEWLLEAAETYSKDTYTATVFPEHNPYAGSYGTVEAVKAETDKNGVVSLFADLAPNAFWQSDMRFKQKMFTSIALMPNFAGTGKMYLYSLAATDTPSSLGVQQLEFSKKQTDVLFSAAFQTQFQSEEKPTEDAEVLSFARRLFNLFKTEDDEMSQSDKDAIKALREKFTALENNYNALLGKLGDGDKSDKTALTAEQFSTLQTENADLKAKVETLEKQSVDFSKLKADFDAHKLEFAKALKEEIPGTDAKKDSVTTAQFSIEHEV